MMLVSGGQQRRGEHTNAFLCIGLWLGGLVYDLVLVQTRGITSLLTCTGVHV